jgi:hypothetical protein
MEEEKIWFNDPQNLITKENFLKFFPTSDMTYIEQINSIVRFGIYLTLILLSILHFSCYITSIIFDVCS